MYKSKKVSLIFPAYNEEKNIDQAIGEFWKLKIIDEIIVVDNNSADQTAKIARNNKAKVIKESRQGYGFALQRGLKDARGDYIVMCEPDGTFVANDLLKLLSRIDRYDMVVGSRTNKNYIGKNANMKSPLRLGNILVAKVIQLLYSPKTNLSDCGCTFRVIKKEVVRKILPNLSVGGSHFLSEFLVVSLSLGFSILEIPVRYRKRIGESKITGSLKRSVLVGMNMLFLALKYKLNKH